MTVYELLDAALAVKPIAAALTEEEKNQIQQLINLLLKNRKGENNEI